MQEERGQLADDIGLSEVPEPNGASLHCLQGGGRTQGRRDNTNRLDNAHMVCASCKKGYSKQWVFSHVPCSPEQIA